MFEFVYFANPVSVIQGKSVYDVRLKLGEKLVRQIKERGLKIDVVTPVPDTSRVAAQRIGELLGVPVREILFKNRYIHRTFIMEGNETRQHAVKLKYFYLKRYLAGKSVLVVDDSIVRGTTSKKIVSKLRELGAKEVHMAITCPPIKYPCYYGIDFARGKELIAFTKSVEEIKEMLGLDSLIYQKIDDLVDAIGIDTLCTACLTGKYVTPLSKKIRTAISKGIINESERPYEQIKKLLENLDLLEGED